MQATIFSCPTDVDFCVSLGGDGTVLHLTSLFVEDTPLPPVISFSMGTLGFLTPFDAGDFQPCLSRVLAANQDPVFCTLRTRKRCEVYWCVVLVTLWFCMLCPFCSLSGEPTEG